MNLRNLFPAAHRAAAIAGLCAGMVCASDSVAAEPDKPLRGEWDFAPVRVWSFDRAGADSLMRPGEPRVSRDGRLFFHDFDRHVSYIVDENGTLAGTFATAGDGPGMVSRYINCFTSDGRVIVASPDKLHFFDHDGAFVSSMPNNIFESFPLVFTSDEVFFAAPGALANLPGGKASIRRISTAGGEARPIHEFTVGDDEKINFGGVILGLIPQINMDYDPAGGRLYFGRNDRYEIFISDLDGTILGRFGLPRERTPVVEEDLRRHFAGTRIPAERVEKIIPLLPRRLTYFYRIQSMDGLVYVFTVDALGSKKGRQNVDIFSADGTYLYRGKIVLPGGDLYENLDGIALSKGFLHAILTDENGSTRIVKYGVSMPPQ